MYDKLLSGKNDIQGIVSIEPKDDYAEIFIQNPDGSLVSQFIKHKYWLLSNKQLDRGFVRLKGDQHYKWGKQFNSKEEYEKDRGMYKYRNDIYNIYDPKEACLIKDGYCYFKGLNIRDVSILSFDLETTSLDPMIPEAKILLISNTFRSKGRIVKKLFSYDDYQSQGEMLQDWCKFIREINPSILIGHNIYSFDLKYLKGIADKEGIQLELGRDGSPIVFEEYESKFRKEASQFIHYHKVRIYGREVIDTFFLAFKHDQATRKYNSYALKNIIKQEGLEKENRVFYDASQIRFNYTNPIEWEKIKTYCEDDSDDSLALFDLMIQPYFYMTQLVPKSFQEIMTSATGGQINSMLVRSYLQEGYSIPKADEIEDFQGALSWGNPGLYRNCLKWDVTSLYPSVIITYSIYNKRKDPEANFLKLVKLLLEKRIEYKKLAKSDIIYDYMQQSFKTLINSMYGACSTGGLNFNYPEGASFITQKGRELLETAIMWSTNKSLDNWKNEIGNL